MKKTLFLLISFILLPSLSYATITYDNGEYNIISTLVDDDIFVIDSATKQATTLELASGGNMFTGRNLYIYGQSKVIVNGGTVGRYLNVYDSASFEIHEGTIYETVILNSTSTATMTGGNVRGHFSLLGNSRLTLSGGSVIQHIYLNNDSVLILQGGSIGRELFAEDNSSVEMSGGWIDEIMHARHDAEITIIGTGFNYPLGYIADASGTLTGTLANGDPIEIPFIIEGNGAILLKDPEIFLTVTAPNGGERFLTGKPVDVEYITEGDTAIETVDIEYSSDNGSSWITVATGISNTGIYEWTTPSIESENFIIRVSSSDNPTITDTSDNTFIIFSCAEINPADLNSDCYVNLADFALFAESWLWCGDRYNPECGF